MKKIIPGILAIFLAANVVTAYAQEPASSAKTTDAAQQQRIKFYYYPSNNIYYNEASSEYLYYDEPTTTWLTVKKLPTTIVVEPTSMKYAVYYNGKDIWKENADHKTKYKVKKEGVKEKP